jgi:hypothetical protein
MNAKGKDRQRGENTANIIQILNKYAIGIWRDMLFGQKMEFLIKKWNK